MLSSEVGSVVDFTFLPIASVLLAQAIDTHGWNLPPRIVMLLLAVSVIKEFTLKVRPDGSNMCSFPSGHTALAFYLARVSGGHPLAYAWATSIAWSRIALHRHDIYDVLMGGFVSTIF